MLDYSAEGKARQGKARQGKARQGRIGEEKTKLYNCWNAFLDIKKTLPLIMQHKDQYLLGIINYGVVLT